MPNLEKARICEITSGDNPRVVGEPTDVQFNPESLKIQLSNRVEGGRSAGRQVRQFIGASSNTFTLDFEFDTADEGTTEEPVSVLERTQILEKFIQPQTEGDNAQEQPSKLRFHWGNLIIDGIVENMDLDFDHFAHNGYPLHAKVTLRLKEQKIEFQFAERGEGGSNNERSAQALDGELPSQAASRLGLDPAAWRGLGLDLSLGLSLEAGLELSFEAGLSASIGVDVKAGFEAGIDVDLSASLGLEVGAQVELGAHLGGDARPRGTVQSGVALAKAGGIAAAADTVQLTRTGQAAGQAAAAFGAPARPAARPGTAAAPRLQSPGTGSRRMATVSAVSDSQARPSARDRPDPRAVSYGFGIPLQPRRVPALTDQSRQRSSYSTAFDPKGLQFVTSARQAADRVQSRRRPEKRCGCRGRCSH